MSSPEKRHAYSVRREQRLSRLKTAAALMPYFLEGFDPTVTDSSELWEASVGAAAYSARRAADILIAEIDDTAPPRGIDADAQEGE